MIQKKVKQFIEENGLIEARAKVIVALSGGADSVSLLHVLHQLGYHCEAAHCNFHLRGGESDRDQAFATALCQKLGINLHVKHFDTAAIAAGRHISIEMAARDLRYEWFDSLRNELQASVIAVGHHRDDNAETMILNLVRGTGLRGLRGIKPRNGHIVRPLLELGRTDLLDYLQDLKQDYITDSTNLHDDFTRNNIRLNLMPLLEGINPSVSTSMLATARHLRGVELVYNQAIAQGKQRVCTPQGIDIQALLAEPSPECLLFEILNPLGFNESQTADIMASLQAQSGKTFSAGAWRVVKDRQMLLLQNMSDQPCNTLKLRRRDTERTPGFKIPADRHIACLDADKLQNPVYLRLWQHGDWFVPLGMKGRKLVSDYLTDHKMPLPQKERQFVLCCGNDIVWLVGQRIDNRYKVDDNTQHVAFFEV